MYFSAFSRKLRHFYDAPRGATTAIQVHPLMASRISLEESKSQNGNSQSIGDAQTSGMIKSAPGNQQVSGPQSFPRRNFLATLSATAVATVSATSLMPMRLQAAEKPEFFAQSQTRELSLRNIHTLEEIDVVYWEDGNYLDDAVLRLSHHLRDHRENETLLIDPQLLDTLWGVRMITDPTMRFNVISGYRTPKTNEMLRKRSNGVAKFSLHMVGKAVDISSNEIPISALRKAGLKLGIGGVGYYPKSRFVHLDTGPARSW